MDKRICSIQRKSLVENSCSWIMELFQFLVQQLYSMDFKNRKCKEFLPQITYKQLDFSIPDFFQTDGDVFYTTPTPCPSHIQLIEPGTFTIGQIQLLLLTLRLENSNLRMIESNTSVFILQISISKYYSNIGNRFPLKIQKGITEIVI